MLPGEWCAIGGGLRYDDRSHRVPDLQVVRRSAPGQDLAASGDVVVDEPVALAFPLGRLLG